MHGRGRRLPGRQMALRISAIVRRDGQRVIIIDVAQSASHAGVAIGQQESRRRVVEDRRRPTGCGVARRALRQGECGTRGRMWRIVGRLPSGKMAPGAAACGGQISGVVVVDVASGARCGHVCAIQREIRHRVVIESGAQPGIEGIVAALAVLCREGRSGARMRRVGCLLPGGQVASGGSATRRQPDKLAYSGVLVALIALQNGVLPKQRKTIEVILNRLHRNIPAERRVALGAIGSKLALVNVGMAIGAVLAYVGEHRFCMALGAIHFFMQAAQGITRGVMIKFRNGANRGPTGGRVTILTRNRQRSVRTTARLPLRLRGMHEGQRQKKKKRQSFPEMEQWQNDCLQTIYFPKSFARSHVLSGLMN